MRTRLQTTVKVALAALLALGTGTTAWASAAVSTAAGANLSAETAGAAYTLLAGPVLSEGVSRDIGLGTIVLMAPPGFAFDPASSVTATVTRTRGSAAMVTLSSANATVSPASITITVTGVDGDTTTRSRLTWSGIRVRPTAGTPLAAGNITNAGTAVISGVTGATSFGTLKELAGAVTQLAFTQQPANATAGAAFGTQPQVKAFDRFGNVSTNGLPPVSYVTAALSSGVGPLAGTTNMNLGTSGGKGTATFSGLRLDVAGADKQLTITSTNGLPAVLSSVFAVSPAAANKLVLAVAPASTATAGLPFAPQPLIQIQDAYNNLRAADNTTVVSATRVSGTGTLLGRTNLTAVNGVVAYTDLAHPVPSSISLRFSSGTLKTATSGTIVVSAGPFSRLLVLLPGETAAPGTAAGKTGTPAATAGASIAVRITATDDLFNPVGGVTDTVALAATDPNAVLPAPLALVNGTNTLKLTFKAAGSQTVTASDITNPGRAAGTGTVSVAPTAFARLQILVPGETALPGSPTGKAGTPNPQALGTAFPVIVNGVDTNWNVVPAASGSSFTIRFTSSDTNAILPANADLASGTLTAQVTLKTAGTATITASDVDDSSKSAATTPLISVSAPNYTRLQLLMPGESPAPGTLTGKTGVPTSQTAGSPFNVTVRAVDTDWNLCLTNSTLAISSSDTNAALPGEILLAGGTATFSLSFKTAGSQTAAAADPAHPGVAPGSGSPTPVNAGPAVKLALVAQPSATATAGLPFAQQPVLQLQDAFGNTSDSSAVVNAVCTGGTVQLMGATNLAASHGLVTFTNLACAVATQITVDFACGAFAPVTSDPITISPGPFRRVLALLPGVTNAPGTATGKTGTPAATTAGATTDLLVCATDLYFNLVNGVTNTVGLTASDPNVVLPPGAPLVNGVATLSLLFHTAGGQTVLATDLDDAATLPDTNSLMVGSGPLAKLQVLAPGETAAPGTETGKTGVPLEQTAETPFSIQVNAVDANWNRVNAADSVHLSASDPDAVLPADAPLGHGTVTLSVTLKMLGNATLSASDLTQPEVGPDTTSSITVNGKQPQTIAFAPLTDIAFGTAPLTLSATASSGLPVAFSLVTGPAILEGNRLTLTGTGAVTVRASQPGNTQFNPAPDVDGSFLVTPASLTVAAEDKSRAVGVANPTFTASYSGFVNNDTAAVLVGRPALATTADLASPAGTYAITAAQGTLSAANYTLTFLNGTLTVTNVPVQPALVTNAFLFAYSNRTALLAAGWSFIATTPSDGQRNTETTSGAVVSYDQAAHPGVLRIPTDAGDLWESANNSRNSLFRSLSPDWVSLRLELSFAPTKDYQQAQLGLYGDDDNYLEIGRSYNGSEGGQVVEMAAEHAGLASTLAATRLTATTLRLGLERDPDTGAITGHYSLDGTNWVLVGGGGQVPVNPRLCIWTGGSPSGLPNCDLRRLEIVTSTVSLAPVLVPQPPHLVFNTIAGQLLTNSQQLHLVARHTQTVPCALTANAAWVSTSVSATNTPAACHVSVNPAGLAPGVYEATLTCTASNAAPAAVAVTLIVNPAARARLATWQGGKAGALSVWIDDSEPTAFDKLTAAGFGGTYALWGAGPVPTYFTDYYLAGMELGSHTVNHDCYALDDPALRYEFETNIAGIVASTPEPQAQLISLAWPCGFNTVAEEVVASDYYLAARGYNLNLLEDPSPADFMNLKSFNSHEHTPYPPDDLKTVVDAAIAQGKWFNLVLHALSNDDGAIAYAVGKNIWAAPGGTVARYILQRDRTVISNYVETSSLVQFECRRLPLEPSAKRSFETALGPQDRLTFRLDLTGLPVVSALLTNGVACPYTTTASAGQTNLYFDALVTPASQTVQLLLAGSAKSLNQDAAKSATAAPPHLALLGLPGRVYQLQWAETPTGPWQSLGAVTADAKGRITCAVPESKNAKIPATAAFFRALAE